MSLVSEPRKWTCKKMHNGEKPHDTRGNVLIDLIKRLLHHPVDNIFSRFQFLDKTSFVFKYA